jgi:hypothetical protein
VTVGVMFSRTNTSAPIKNIDKIAVIKLGRLQSGLRIRLTPRGKLNSPATSLLFLENLNEALVDSDCGVCTSGGHVACSAVQVPDVLRRSVRDTIGNPACFRLDSERIVAPASSHQDGKRLDGSCLSEMLK